MFELVIVYVFYVCLFPANGDLLYTIYRSGIDTSNLKLKVGGTIDLPVYNSDSEPTDDGGPVNVLRTSNYSFIDHASDDGSPLTDSASSKTEASDYSDNEKDASRGSSTEESTKNGDTITSLKNVTEINNGTEVVHAGVRDERTDKPEINILRKDNMTGLEETPHAAEQKIPQNPAFIPVEPALRILTTTILSTKKPKPPKVQDDEMIRTFSEHVYKQALRAFGSMKKNTDPYTQTKIDSLAEIYKEKFKEFIHRARNTPIKTNQGPQNVILHTIDTSNLLMQRIINFLKTDILGSGTNTLQHGGALRLQKEVDTLKITEFEHACKMYGICRSAQGFRNELQDILSTLLTLPDNKLLQVNDAVTEILKNADLSAFTHSNPIQDRIKKAIRRQERTNAPTLRSNLQIIFAALSKSHQPLILDKEKSFEKPAVKRTVLFHSLLDAIEDALPPTEDNKKEWSSVKDRLKRWKHDNVLVMQEAFQALFNNVNRGVGKYGAVSGKIRELFRIIIAAEEEE